MAAEIASGPNLKSETVEPTVLVRIEEVEIHCAASDIDRESSVRAELSEELKAIPRYVTEAEDVRGMLEGVGWFGLCRLTENPRERVASKEVALAITRETANREEGVLLVRELTDVHLRLIPLEVKILTLEDPLTKLWEAMTRPTVVTETELVDGPLQVMKWLMLGRSRERNGLLNVPPTRRENKEICRSGHCAVEN